MQIANFGMARDVTEVTHCVYTEGKVPVKWMAPEVGI